MRPHLFSLLGVRGLNFSSSLGGCATMPMSCTRRCMRVADTFHQEPASQRCRAHRSRPLCNARPCSGRAQRELQGVPGEVSVGILRDEVSGRRPPVVEPHTETLTFTTSLSALRRRRSGAPGRRSRPRGDPEDQRGAVPPSAIAGRVELSHSPSRGQKTRRSTRCVRTDDTGRPTRAETSLALWFAPCAQPPPSS